MSEERIWYQFDDPRKMSLFLGSAMHLLRDLLAEGKVEDAKKVIDGTLQEMNKYKMADSDKMTALYFGKK